MLGELGQYAGIELSLRDSFGVSELLYVRLREPPPLGFRISLSESACERRKQRLQLVSHSTASSLSVSVFIVFGPLDAQHADKRPTMPSR